MLNLIKKARISLLLIIIFSLFSAFIYAAPPRPHPPPCSIQSAGCYKIGDVRVNFGELTPNNFSFFLPENKCLKNETCDCKGIPSDVDEQRDADQSVEACSCITPYDWSTNAKCCGDDVDDCGKITSGVLCSIDSNTSSATWITSNPDISGEIRYVGCSKVEYLSDGTTWTKCNGTFWRKTIGNNEYICIGKGRESIVECCGDGSCQSRVDGKRLSTGQSVNSTLTINSSSFVGVAIQRPKHDYGPSIINDGGIYRMYWCTMQDDGTGDAIWYSSSNDGINWGNFRKVLDPTPNSEETDFTPDGHVCDPSVVKVGNTYYMYYTSASFSGVNNEIFLAKSQDGINWEKYPSNLNPQPVIKNTIRSGQYGIGQSAIFYLNEKFYHYYTNTDKGGEMLAFSTDGINWAVQNNNNPVFLGDNLVPTYLKDYNLFFAAKASDELTNDGIYYSFSTDGITWNPNAQSASNKLAVGGGRGSIHNIGILTDIAGIVTGSLVMVYYGAGSAGQQGNFSSDTWDIDITRINFNIAGTKTYYCRSDSKFVIDLDTPSSQINDTALNNKNKATCEKAGFKWTGTKCCSENDDINEYYNDPSGVGGCWNKKQVISTSFVDGTNNSVINYNGEFHGCTINSSNFNTNNNNLLNIKDQHTRGRLITNHQYCFNDPENNYYCSYTEEWLPTDGADKTHLSYSPLNYSPVFELLAECCAQLECWNGTRCVENQKAKPLEQPLDGKRCVDGNWVESHLKNTSDGTKQGYCPREEQCLLNPLAQVEKEQCVESGNYTYDDYCEEGNWSSRTKLLALKLLKLKSGDYTLFCDKRENTLNYLLYIIGDKTAADILTNLQTNNLCVLKLNNRVVVAGSVNNEIEQSKNLFGVSSCDANAFLNDGQYHSCDATNKVWYNKKLKSFIYSATAVTIPSEQESSSFIRNLIKVIIDTIKRLISNPPYDESYLAGINKFDKLYLAQQGSKTIKASIDGKHFKNAVMEYAGFETNICNFIDKFNQTRGDVYSGASCKKEGSNYYVLVQGSQLTNIDPESIWQDLTSKLRLK